MNERMRHLIVFIVVLSISTFGCVSIPDTVTMESQPEKFDALPTILQCQSDSTEPTRFSASAISDGFNASGLSLLNWNIQKENQKGWKRDLVRFSQEADILVLQEAYLTEELRLLLDGNAYYWHLVTAFEYQDVKSGVLTAATLAPDFICPLRAAEPLIRFPKTMLITRYPLANTHHTLMIVNIHMINFAPQSAFRDQTHQMTDVLIHHRGPLILAGDFNTWSEERLAIIEEMARRLALLSVDFKTDLVRKVFGHTVDHVYYRGLTVESARVIEVSSSDHNPLLVKFRLNEDG